MISYSIPCKNNLSSNFLFNFIKNELEQNNISDVKLIFDEDQKKNIYRYFKGESLG